MKQLTTYPLQEAKKRLERYCAYQERCPKEVLLKLKEIKAPLKVVKSVMAYLKEQNYLNEERFAKNFARGKFNIKKWGKQRIVKELKAREISEYAIANALKEINAKNYEETFSNLVRKRFSQLKETDDLLKKRKKLTDYLLYRGWELELIDEKVNQLMK